MPRRFPCPYCKGEGTWVEPVLDDGSGPTYGCGFCDGSGMIEVGSEKHRDIKRNNPPKDIMWEMIAERDCALGKVIDALEHLPADGWSDGPRLLELCRKAKGFFFEPNMDNTP